MFFRHHTDKLIAPVVVVGLLFATSYRAKYHLRSTMPDAFFHKDDHSSRSSADRALALSYWNAALLNVQWRYPYSHPLPPDPPPDFQIAGNAPGAGAPDPAARVLYWRRLQHVWYQPEAWDREYGWDFGWIKHPVDSGGEWLRDVTDRLFSVR
jgi:hypothetical protein